MIGLFIALLAAPRAEDAPPWRLVAAYDLADLVALDPSARTDWAWRPDAMMTGSCGPAKAPDGLGAFDAEVMAWGMSPTLALVLERQEGAPPGPPSHQHVRVAVGRDRPEVSLQPAVMPRSVLVELDGVERALSEGEQATWQLVRRQLEMLLCLEHKVGRGWTGGSAEQVRQAILLDAPDSDERGRHLPDRKFFGGQLAPVAAYLGPPRACILRGEVPAPGVLRGQSSVDLVPADLWGASLDRCPAELALGEPVEADAGELMVPLAGGDGGQPLTLAAQPLWSHLSVSVTREEARSCIRARWRDGRSEALLVDKCVDDVEGESAVLELEGLPDLLAGAPLTLPTFGAGEDPHRYALLLIPNWQLVEALSGPMGRGGRLATADAVTWLLDNPQHLFVQVQPDGAAFSGWSPGAKAMELTGGLGRGAFDPQRRWGYMTGLLAGREPLIVIGRAPPAWAQVRRGQRADAHAASLAGMFVLLVMVLGGLVRVQELWRRVPEERAAYWPGRPQDKKKPGSDAPDAPGTTIVPASGA